MYAMKEADKCRANRIVFESDSDDDNEAVYDESFPDKHVQSDTQVGATAQFAIMCEYDNDQMFNTILLKQLCHCTLCCYVCDGRLRACQAKVR